MNSGYPHILLVNPWICDFAAYDFWAKPMGLLMLAALLRQHGFNISYIDCLDRFHSEAAYSHPHSKHGMGNYLKTRIPKPHGLEDVPRYFSRYGIREEWFREDLHNSAKPDLIFVTSLMTYQYPGLQHTIRILKEYFPNTPVILGGIYATLCTDHARKHSGADQVIAGHGETAIFDIIAEYIGIKTEIQFDPNHPDSFPYPAFDLQNVISYVPILTSRGCPFSCAYCASRVLEPKIQRRHPENVAKEILFWHKTYHVSEFAFYDDALLTDAEHYAIPLLEMIVSSGIRIFFHTPNALHIREITPYLAELMFKAGFETIRLGLETTDFDQRGEWDRKVTENEFFNAIHCLRSAGFGSKQIGAYLLVGLPGQAPESVEDSVKTVISSGIMPVLTHYTPIPHTAFWQKAVAASRYDLESDPIYTNNAIFPCSPEFPLKMFSHLKRLAAS
ncbi:MAG: radical SAM protein [Desulfobacteraceae bacterium]|nr:radical SAM protein [Desulfobacteraceae bacterium]